MKKTIYKIVIGLIIALGGIHILFTLGTFDKFSADAIWFASAGVAVILAGFLNIVLLREAGREDAVARLLCVVANLALFVLFVLLLLIFPEAHIFFGAGLFVAATAFSLIGSREQGGKFIQRQDAGEK